jgi:hypothetical protein
LWQIGDLFGVNRSHISRIKRGCHYLNKKPPQQPIVPKEEWGLTYGEMMANIKTAMYNFGVNLETRDILMKTWELFQMINVYSEGLPGKKKSAPPSDDNKHFEW